MVTKKKTVKKAIKKPVKDKKKVDLEQDFWGSDYVTTNDLMKVGQVLNKLTDIIEAQHNRLDRLEERYGKLADIIEKQSQDIKKIKLAIKRDNYSIFVLDEEVRDIREGLGLEYLEDGEDAD